MQDLISIVVPVFNEQHNLVPLYQALQKVLTEYEYEIIFVNDGSRDNSWKVIQELAQKDSRIKAINFSRNFGHQAALTAGYDCAQGDAIISMDADMQDPPELIVQMLEKWQQGFDVVYARRINRNDGHLKQLTAWGYYKFLDAVSDVTMPRNVGDFRLIDKKVLDELKQCKERSRYLRGMVAWLGFNHTFVDFKRPDRLSGTTGYTWKKMFKLAFDGLTSFSMFPLKIAAFVGMFVIVSGSGMFVYIAYDALIRNVRYPLFKWLTTIIYIFMGVQFLLMWLLGEYIGRIYDQEKGRPLYIVKETLNT